jgi:hypothetical protein
MDSGKMTVLDAIKERPAMYLTRPSVTALIDFLSGFDFARHEIGIELPRIIPDGFGPWVYYRLRRPISTLVGLREILKAVPEEAQALECFFQLLDEYKRRKETLVATTKTRRRTSYVVNLQSCEPDENSRPLTEKFKEWAKNFELPNGLKYVRNVWKHPAESLKSVVYTDDPGFFLMPTDKPEDSGHFYESLDCTRGRLGPR